MAVVVCEQGQINNLIPRPVTFTEQRVGATAANHQRYDVLDYSYSTLQYRVLITVTRRLLLLQPIPLPPSNHFSSTKVLPIKPMRRAADGRPLIRHSLT